MVDDVPEPVEVSEGVMGHIRAGLQQQPHPGPELGCNRTKPIKEARGAGNQERGASFIVSALLLPPSQALSLCLTTKVNCAGVMM